MSVYQGQQRTLDGEVRKRPNLVTKQRYRHINQCGKRASLLWAEALLHVLGGVDLYEIIVNRIRQLR